MPIWNENDLILLILRAVILSKSAPDINWQVGANLEMKMMLHHHIISIETFGCKL